jgi:hypothetical protein
MPILRIFCVRPRPEDYTGPSVSCMSIERLEIPVGYEGHLIISLLPLLLVLSILLHQSASLSRHSEIEGYNSPATIITISVNG